MTRLRAVIIDGSGTIVAIRARFLAAGAHHVADSVGDATPLLQEIDSRLEQGERS